MSNGEGDRGGGHIAALWAALLAEFNKYGGLHHTEIANWSSRNGEVETLKASTVRDWKNPERTTAPKRGQFVTLLTYLDHLRTQANRGEGAEPTGPSEQNRAAWWDLWHPAWDERMARRQSGSGAGADDDERSTAGDDGALPGGAESRDSDSAEAASLPHSTADGPRPARRRRVALTGVTVAGIVVALVAAYLAGRLSTTDANAPSTAGGVSSPSPTYAPGSESASPTRSHVTSTPGPGESSPSTPPVFCARVIVEQAGLYRSPGDLSSWLRWKARNALITMWSSEPADGWLKVCTPKDPSGAHAWMRASDLSSPDRCDGEG
jgi:hypothetical protein